MIYTINKIEHGFSGRESTSIPLIIIFDIQCISFF